jgi:hypothetical protein
MREELTWAIDLVRRESRRSRWFIPVKLSPCDIPRLPIGFGEDLSSLHFVDLSVDTERGLAQILRAIGGC